MSEPILKAEHLGITFGGLKAVSDFNMTINSGELVGLIGPNGEQVGVIATSVALNRAKEANLDLVEVAPNAKPPVAKLIDYGKFKYNEKIKAREARRNQSTA